MGKNILIVDDDPGIRTLTSRTLVRDGHKVYCAIDGAEGLIQAAKEKYDLIISDVQMPRMSGVKMVKTLRRQGINTPVYLMTGSLGEFAEEAQAMVADGVVLGILEKPFSPSQVLRLVDDY